MYTYRADMLRVVDGDTIELEIDLGFRVKWRSTVRISKINAPELSTDAGQAAKQFLFAYLPIHTLGVLTSHGFDKYGRVLGDFLPDGSMQTVGQVMIANGHAVATQ